MVPAAVIVYGPLGCGKNANSEVLRKHFGCDVVAWTTPMIKSVQRGYLYLTTEYPQHLKFKGDLKILSYEQAMKQVQDQFRDPELFNCPKCGGKSEMINAFNLKYFRKCSQCDYSSIVTNKEKTANENWFYKIEGLNGN